MASKRIRNGLTLKEQQYHLEELVLKRAEELKLARKERRRAATERKKMIAAEHALRILQRTFKQCSRCSLMVLKKENEE